MTTPLICPTGKFCPAGTSTPQDCTAGKFSDRTGLATSDECQPCLPGDYCDTAGRSSSGSSCAAGFYCLEGSTVPNPTDGVVGNVCPLGKFCVAGTKAPEDCPEGTYGQVAGLQNAAQCNACPAGYYCPLRGATTDDYFESG